MRFLNVTEVRLQYRKNCACETLIRQAETMPDYSVPEHLRKIINESDDIYKCALAEARAYKWLLSERCGYDVGDYALQDWYQRFWKPFLRWRFFEHLSGDRCFQQFTLHNFGRLRHPLFHYLPEARFAVRKIRDDGWQLLTFAAQLHCPQGDCPPEEQFPGDLAQNRLFWVLDKLDMNTSHIPQPEWGVAA